MFRQSVPRRAHESFICSSSRISTNSKFNDNDNEYWCSHWPFPTLDVSATNYQLIKKKSTQNMDCFHASNVPVKPGYEFRPSSDRLLAELLAERKRFSIKLY